MYGLSHLFLMYFIHVMYLFSIVVMLTVVTDTVTSAIFSSHKTSCVQSVQCSSLVNISHLCPLYVPSLNFHVYLSLVNVLFNTFHCIHFVYLYF